MTEEIDSTAGSPIPHSPRLEAVATDISTERDRIFSERLAPLGRSDILRCRALGVS